MILAILQARCSSTRLPGKVMMPILDKPMIWQQWCRIQRSTMIDQCILASSTDYTDDVLIDYFTSKQCLTFRGSLDNVLERFYQCASIFKPIHIVRLTGDCPLIDITIIDQAIKHHLDNKHHYTHSIGFPNGMNAEIFTYQTLKKTYHEANTTAAIEHVTYYMYQKTSPFDIGFIKSSKDLSTLRLTVDCIYDFELITHIYNGLYINNPYFNLQHILDFLNRYPELIKINSHIKQKPIVDQPIYT